MTYGAGRGPTAGLIGLPIGDCTLSIQADHDHSWEPPHGRDVAVL